MGGYKNLIVGAGLSGAVAARKIAEELDEKALVIDERDHIGGNMYDYRENGIMIHKYGPHIFHTNNKEVWDFISRFTKWEIYHHRVLGLIDGSFAPIPFNLNSLRMLFPDNMAGAIENKLLDNFGFNKKIPILELRKTNDKDLNFLAEYIYQKVFLEYTIKQWGLPPEKIDPSVSARIPVYISRDNRYFQDKYQGVPLDGYTRMLENMLDHKNIEVKLNMPFAKDMRYDRLFWTGSIDRFFDYKFGYLPYRSLFFDFIAFDREKFQDAAQVNYPSNYDFTRVTEYKHFLSERSDKTIVSYEYPIEWKDGGNDRMYPIANAANSALYEKYIKMGEGSSPNVKFFGRLGDYKYYDMDKACARALELFKEI